MPRVCTRTTTSVIVKNTIVLALLRRGAHATTGIRILHFTPWAFLFNTFFTNLSCVWGQAFATACLPAERSSVLTWQITAVTRCGRLLFNFLNKRMMKII